MKEVIEMEINIHHNGGGRHKKNARRCIETILQHFGSWEFSVLLNKNNIYLVFF